MKNPLARSYLLWTLCLTILSALGTTLIQLLLPNVQPSPWIAVQLFITLVILLPGLYQLLLRRWVEPLKALKKTVEDLSRENFGSRVHLAHHDELGQLATLLNQTASHLELVFAKLTIKTRTDLLTGLPSRAQILMDITQAATPILVLLNIDYFKELNDSYGNRTGDLILKSLAAKLQEFQKTFGYKLYKMPADEFALLFDAKFERTELEYIIETIANEINENEFMIEDTAIQIHVTCGASIGTEEKPSQDHGVWRNLATNADMALKKAKRHLQPFLIFHESLDIQKEFQKNIFWKRMVKQALTDNRIIAYFQPIINNQTLQVEKFETLVRLIDPEDTVFLPGEFLDIAKRSHIYAHITKTVIAQAFRTFSLHPFEFSVNLTVNDILNKEIHSYIRQLLEKNPEVASRLVFEILESEGIENYKEVREFIDGVKEYQCKIAIDDFGSGYSNFDHLLRLKVDYIKLDSSLIQNIDTDRNAQIITRTIVNFSRELGLKTIAEHVHTEEVFAMTRELGVDFSQGFYFGQAGKPLPSGRLPVLF